MTDQTISGARLRPIRQPRERGLARRSLLQAASAAAGAAAGAFAFQRLHLGAGAGRVNSPIEPAPSPAGPADPQAAYDELMRTAYENIARKVGDLWGVADARLPERTVAVDYDEAMTSRVVIDYAAGELRLETLMAAGEPEDRAQARLDALERRAGMAQMGMSDPVTRMVGELAEAHGMAMPKAEPADDPMLMIEQLVAPERPRRRPAATIETTASGRRKMTMTRRLGPTFLRDLARRYREPILREAARRDLAPSLLLAVIQTESAFNPRAASPAPAYGLMQLVPRSGGADAYRFVNGRPRILDPEMLFVPDTNIKLGAAYLQLLLTRYLRAVDDPTSRLYCSIAAYNTGAGNVARAFTGSTSVAGAAPLINALDPDAVFAHLRTRLPFEETRTYLARVTERREQWRDWDQHA